MPQQKVKLEWDEPKKPVVAEKKLRVTETKPRVGEEMVKAVEDAGKTLRTRTVRIVKKEKPERTIPWKEICLFLIGVVVGMLVG